MTEGTSRDRCRVERSRTTTQATEASPSTDQTSKPSVPGRMMSSTPPKPIRMASIRRQPIRSRKTRAAASVTANGSDCRIADRLASGMCINAVRNNPVAPISASVRTPMIAMSRRVSRWRSPPITAPSTSSMVSVSPPRIAMASDSGIVSVAAFMPASFSVKAAMAIIM